MHGLNTRQLIEFSTNYNKPDSGTELQSTVANLYAPGNSASLSTILGTGFVTDVQFWLKRYYYDITVANVNHLPVYMEVTWLRARKDITANQTFAGIINDDVISNVSAYTASETPYCSPFTGDTFRRNYKILKSRTTLLRPLRPRRLIIKVQKKYLRKAITFDVEGDPNFTARAGDILLFIRYYGIPVNLTNTSFTGATAIGPVYIRQIVRRYCSWYNMNDIEPTSTITNNIPTTLGTDNAAFSPSYTVAVKPSETITNYPSGRQWVWSQAP